MVPIRFSSWMVIVGAVLVLFASGCVVQRTVKEDGVVVDRGYVIRDPL